MRYLKANAFDPVPSSPRQVGMLTENSDLRKPLRENGPGFVDERFRGAANSNLGVPRPSRFKISETLFGTIGRHVIGTKWIHAPG